MKAAYWMKLDPSYVDWKTVLPHKNKYLMCNDVEYHYLKQKYLTAIISKNIVGFTHLTNKK